MPRKRPFTPGARRTSFGRAAAADKYLDALRRDTRASILGAVDWMLHRHAACPWNPKGHAAKAYHRAFKAEQLSDPHPDYPPIPDLPRARAPLGATPHEINTQSPVNSEEISPSHNT